MSKYRVILFFFILTDRSHFLLHCCPKTLRISFNNFFLFSMSVRRVLFISYLPLLRVITPKPYVSSRVRVSRKIVNLIIIFLREQKYSTIRD